MVRLFEFVYLLVKAHKMNKKSPSTRRNFLKTGLAGALGAPLLSFKADGLETKPDEFKIKEYRRLGRTNFEVSDISMGAGGLTNPAVMKAALDMGVNYIDTAEHYARGKSEESIGEAIKDFDRKKIFITSKLNLDFFGDISKEGLTDRFYKILERLQTPYVDCLMIHMAQSTEQILNEPFHQMFREMKAEGKVKYLGLSNHGPEHRLAGGMKEPMEKVIGAAAEDGRFDLVLFVYNFIQQEQGARIIELCKKKDMGMTLMKVNPVKFYESAQSMIKEAQEQNRELSDETLNNLAEYEKWVQQADAFKAKYGLISEEDVRDASIKFVISNPDISAVCHSMNSFDELETFVGLSGKRLSENELGILNHYKESLGNLYCRHACGICEPSCPHNVPVNTILRYNHYFEAQKHEKRAMEKYKSLQMGKNLPCSTCSGYCLAACPHNIPAQALLVKAEQNLSLIS